MPATVLVVEDNESLREPLVELLTDEGYAVRAAEHGQAALDILQSWRPDLILLDLAMPVMDGLAFLARISAIPAAATIPVIVLSAYIGYLEGTPPPNVVVVIQKPYDVARLLETVADVLAKGRPE